MLKCIGKGVEQTLLFNELPREINAASLGPVGAAESAVCHRTFKSVQCLRQ